jgi:hypothetical protein
MHESLSSPHLDIQKDLVSRQCLSLPFGPTPWSIVYPAGRLKYGQWLALCRRVDDDKTTMQK